LAIEPAILASEIERLPDLQGFLKLASSPDWRRVKLTLERGQSEGMAAAAGFADNLGVDLEPREPNT
ncbi:MAG: hypothetical protein ACREU3_11425, partial [Steroidobacteraceae bacterium]